MGPGLHTGGAGLPDHGSDSEEFFQKLLYEGLVVGGGFGQPVAEAVEEHEVGCAVHPVVLPGVA